MADKNCVAFALGGLGGFNAHGVGFLKAAQDQGLKPDLISCTSGQILWTAHYLAGEDIEAMINAQIDEANVFPKPFDWMNAFWIASKGDEGIFRPAYLENFMDMLKPMDQLSANELLNRFLPARKFIPERPDAEFDRVVDIFNKSDIGIMFNSFWPSEGKEYVHMNEAALKLTRSEYNDEPLDNGTVIAPIDREAVKAALWLYLYGFDCQGEKHECQIDGAYHRQFIIRELCRCSDVVFSVRPQNQKWLGEMPKNDLEMKNFTTQLWFNSSYQGETGRLRFINKLLADGKMVDTEYRHIHLAEIELDVPIKFDQYFVERTSVYQEGYDDTVKKINELREDGLLS